MTASSPSLFSPPPFGGQFPRLAIPFFDLCIGRLEVTPIRSESAVPRTMELALLGNRTLQTLIRGNFVCFPSQAPVFGQRSRRDLQWRFGVLYFVRGWSTRLIADRYGLTRERCGQIISDWRIRAIALGYIQDVTPEGTDLARLADSQTIMLPTVHHGAANVTATLIQNGVLPQAPPQAMPAAKSVPDVTPVIAIQAATALSASPAIPRTSLAMSPGTRLPSTLR